MDYMIENGMKDLVYDTFNVVPVKVGNNSSEVLIEDEIFNNDQFDCEPEKVLQKIMESKNYGRNKLTSEHPEIAANLKLFLKHTDVRSHAYYFLKCHKLGSKFCKYCEENPAQCSDLFWSTLPKRETGGLFYGVVEDEDSPGHNRTFLDMLRKVQTSSIVPDSEFGEVMRCKVS